MYSLLLHHAVHAVASHATNAHASHKQFLSGSKALKLLAKGVKERVVLMALGAAPLPLQHIALQIAKPYWQAQTVPGITPAS